MAISRKLLIRIRDFLVPHDFLGHRNGRRAISVQAGLDDELMNQVDFEGPTDEFLTLYLKVLSRYGKLRDDRDALEAFLEAMKDKVGMDDDAIIDEFIERWREERQVPPRIIRGVPSWLLVSIAVIAGFSLIYVLLQPKPPTLTNTTVEVVSSPTTVREVPPSMSIKEEDETPYKYSIRLFKKDAAAMLQKDNTLKYIVGAVQTPVEAATKPFTWSLSTRPGLKISGQAFRVTRQGSNELLAASNADGSLDFTVPECERGDKLVAILRIIGKEDPSFKDFEQIKHIVQILDSKVK